MQCVTILLFGAFLSGLLGCAQSRHDQLRGISSRVEKELRTEQREVLAMTGSEQLRSQRLDHLGSLRNTHAAADIALASVPRLLDGDNRLMAYDILEEVYGVIEWNIPLLPGEGTKPLPNAFSSNGLDFNALRAGQLAPSGGGPAGGHRSPSYVAP